MISPLSLCLLLVFVSLTALAAPITQRDGNSDCTYWIWNTEIKGQPTEGGACRFTVEYGKAERWGESTINWDWQHSNQTFAELPPACPQPAGTDQTGFAISEECLFATVHIPRSATPLSKLPVFVWIHGGSFTAGSASTPGLDGSKLATKGNMIVVVLQYRLGVLGFIAPPSAPSWTDPNLGLRDVILGLKVVNQVARFAGGDAWKVTVGGQSSGASMIRALWGSPAAKGLFRAAILQSDPMIYGFAQPSITAHLRDAFYSEAPLSACSTLDCLRAIPVSEILTAEDQLTGTAVYNVEGVPFAEPIRPTYRSVTLPADPTTQLFENPWSLPIQPFDLPLLITTVKNEGGSATQRLFSDPVPMDVATYYAAFAQLIGSDRAKALQNSATYALPNQTGFGQDGDTFREYFERATTDGTWRCANRDAAAKWASAGGKVWVGEWTQGVTYPDNGGQGDYCTTKGRVCHEDDIYPTFGTAPNPSGDTTTLEDSVFSHWSSFINDLDPNFGWDKVPWKRYYGNQQDIFPLGQGGPVMICPEGFWGSVAKYDWQLYG
ncbi:hypothetical protein IAR55_002464 [Kwoniella newhampshirensis]|uniref:Carboxylesterase type B domain-containing protein n=1 Tax=Kwoniella newhampshirensis TaxID=1651941 RepID=A0AAW0Z128_9TREE